MTNFAMEATDGSGYGRNGLVFTTRNEARLYGNHLFMRWFACKGWRAIEVDEPVNKDYTAEVDRASVDFEQKLGGETE